MLRSLRPPIRSKFLQLIATIVAHEAVYSPSFHHGRAISNGDCTIFYRPSCVAQVADNFDAFLRNKKSLSISLQKTDSMEGATGNMWGIPETLSPADGGLNTWLFMEPSPSASAELVSNQFPKTTDADLNTQVSGPTRYTAARKKRLHDKAYRERRKELKMNIEIKMDELAKENDRLRKENDSLKKEQVLPVQTLQHQKDEMKQLEKELGKLEDQLNSRNMVVEVLLKQSTGSNNKDLQRENALLKHCFNQLTKEISIQENINEIQLREKIERLENKRHSLQVIIDALCEKINDDQDRAAWTS